MSDKTLLRFLERLNTDSSFLESAVANPEGAFAAFGLTSAEQAAIRSGDEDALRRMTGMDVSGYMLGSSSSSIIYTGGGRPRPTDTPGSGNGCGTGSTHNCFVGGYGQ
jgi:hypothetical protein